MDATCTITTFVLIDTAMTNLDHQTDVRAGVPDSEVASVALVAAKYFTNNHRFALNVMQQLLYLSGSISHSRLNSRLHVLRDWITYFPELLSDMLSKSRIYIIDSMPIPVCRRARTKRCTKITVHPTMRCVMPKMHRKPIETCNSQLEKMIVARPHARRTTGISLKIAALFCTLSVSTTARLAIRLNTFCDIIFSS